MEERETGKGEREVGVTFPEDERRREMEGRRNMRLPHSFSLFIHWNSSERELELRSVIEHFNNIILFRDGRHFSTLFF